jgi:AbrB family looped-hinge helix DNA binding protein
MCDIPLRWPTPDAFPVHLRSRGRIVLPAQIRTGLNLREGDELVVTVEPDTSLRLTSVRQVLGEIRGLYKARAGNRSLADELIAERRAEVRRASA